MKYLIISAAICFAVSQTTAQSDSAQFYFKKGMDEKTARRYMVAASYFDKAIHSEPKYTEAYIENGKTNLEMRRIDAAQGNFLKAYQLQPENADAVKELLTLYFNNRQFQKAIDLAQKCTSCPDAERIIAISNYNLEDYNKAIIGLQKVLAKNPADAEAAYTLGRSYMEMDDYIHGIPQYQKAIEIDNTRSTWMYELGLMYYNVNDFPNALKYFKMAEEKGLAKSNDFLENIGFAYLNTGDVENGMKNLQAVLARTPNSRDLLTNIADAVYHAKKYDDALTYYQKLLELDPKNANALYMAGMAFQKKGDKDKGKMMCDAAIKIDPSLAKNRTKIGESFGL